jgi:hypothetical protein
MRIDLDGSNTHQARRPILTSRKAAILPRFNRPPGWPEPPKGWLPDLAWSPDPTWPKAPPDWVLVIDDESPSAPRAKSPLALLTLSILSILSIILVIPGIPTLILSILAVYQRKRKPLLSRRLTTAGWITYGTLLAITIAATIVDYTYS